MAEVSGGPEDFETVGRGSHRDGNIAKAYQRAETDAVRQVLEQVTELLMGSELFLKNYPLIQERILKDPRKYLKEYRIRGRLQKGNTVIVRMVTQIHQDVLIGDLQAAGLLRGDEFTLPVVAVFVNPGEELGWWNEGGKAGEPAPITAAVVEQLRRHGFEVLDPQRGKGKGLQPQSSPARVREFVRGLGGDAVLTLEWNSDLFAQKLDALTYAAAQVKISSAHLLSVKDGILLAEVVGEGVAGKVLPRGQVPSKSVNEGIENEAMDHAAQAVAIALTSKLAEKNESKSPNVKLVVAGLHSYVAFTRFRQVLAHKVPSVKRFTLVAAERGEFSFNLALGNSIDGFAKEIVESAPGEFVMKVTEKTDERVVLHVEH